MKPRRAALLPWLAALAAGCASDVAERTRVQEEVRRAAARLLRDPAANPGAAAPQRPLSLEDCYRLAAAQSERLAAIGEGILQADLRKREAIAAILPRVTAAGTWFRQDDDGTAGGGGAAGPERREVRLTARQPIFSGFREFHGWEAARALAEARRAGAAAFVRTLCEETAGAFYAVLSAEAERRTRSETIRASRERLREVEERRSGGLARRTEVLLLRAQLSADEAELSRAESAARLARLDLGFLLGRDPPETLRDDVPAEPVPPSPEAAAAEALAAREEIGEAERDADAVRAAARAVRAEFWPTLAAVGNAYPYRRGFSRAAQETDWDVSLVAEWPLFEGGAFAARERAARSRAREAELTLAQRRRDVEREARSAFERLRLAAAVLSTREEGLRSAEENYRLVEGEYRQGLATNLEVLTGLRLLNESRLAFERQRLDRRLAGVRFRLARGAPPARDTGEGPAP